MAHYYFVVSAFPSISLNLKLEITYDAAREMLWLNLSPKDLKQVEVLQHLVDIRNIRALWLHEPIDPRGNYGEKALEEALLVRDRLPPFITAFLERYEQTEERLRYFPSLFASLFRESLPNLSGFLLKYFQMERESRLILAALRAKEAGRDLIREFQFEDPEDPFVAALIAQRDEKDIAVPPEYQDLKNAFLENFSEPKKLERAILQVRLTKIEEWEAARPFTMDQVLGLLARLAIVEAWNGLDEEKGRALLKQVR